MPKLWEADVHKTEVNYKSRSDVMSNGTPNREIHVLIIVWVHSLDVGPFTGIASGQRVYILMIS